MSVVRLLTGLYTLSDLMARLKADWERKELFSFLPLSVQLGMSMREDACGCVNAVHLDGAARCKL